MLVSYEDQDFLELSHDAAFDRIRDPTVAAPYSGIYRSVICQRCQKPLGERPLPRQNHHQQAHEQDRFAGSS